MNLTFFNKYPPNSCELYSLGLTIIASLVGNCTISLFSLELIVLSDT